MPSVTKVGEIMAKEVFSVDIEDTIHKADEIMRNEHIRHVPVLEGTKFVGLITERSLMEYSLRNLYDYEDEFGEMGYNKITDFNHVMTKNVQIIYPEDSVKKAIEIMIKRKVDILPVVDWDKNLVGILSFIDILLFVNQKFTDLRLY